MYDDGPEMNGFSSSGNHEWTVIRAATTLQLRYPLTDIKVIARVREMLKTPDDIEILRFKVGDSGPDGER